MRKLKNYFKMMITAVICFAMSLVPGKKGKEVLEKLLFGLGNGKQKGSEGFIMESADALANAESAFVCKESRVIGCENDGCKLYLNHVLVPVVGPGDWKQSQRERKYSDGVLGSIIERKNEKVIPFPLKTEKKEFGRRSVRRDEIKTLLYETSG